ncbi:hypothetical protein [Burkholderia ubonensis]|uniref:hypothetical protein n=1 Tax=Burkholderia ubonensis TaxID=101571 RepID=UPI000A59C22E|nr:hypothetical protein [Burkholderia ubonensis]
MDKTILLSTDHLIGQMCTRPAGQPIAPVLRLVGNNEHLKSRRELVAENQQLTANLAMIADCILAAAEIIAKIDCR